MSLLAQPNRCEALVPACTAPPFAVYAGHSLRTSALGQVCVLAIKGGDIVAVGLFADNVAVHVTDYLAAIHSFGDFAAACFQELRCCRIVPCFGGGIGATRLTSPVCMFISRRLDLRRCASTVLALGEDM